MLLGLRAWPSLGLDAQAGRRVLPRRPDHRRDGEADLAQTITLSNGYVISDDRARLDMGFVHHWLATTYWAADRPRSLTERSWAHCLCFGLYDPGGAPVGFGRLLTDFALRAHLGDVFIHAAHRGLGLGKALVEAVLSHPELATVTHWTLTTGDAHGLYARYGFRPGEADGRWMTLVRPPAA